MIKIKSLALPLHLSLSLPLPLSLFFFFSYPYLSPFDFPSSLQLLPPSLSGLYLVVDALSQFDRLAGVLITQTK